MSECCAKPQGQADDRDLTEDGADTGRMADESADGAHPATAALPQWVRPVVAAMRTSRTVLEIVPLPVLVEEVDDWRRHAREESWNRKLNRASLSEELEASASRTGMHLARQVDVPLTAYRRFLRGLVSQRVVVSEDLEELHQHSTELMTVLTAHDAFEAGWRDVLGAARARDADALEWDLSCLESMIEATRRAPRETLRDAASVLEPDSRLLGLDSRLPPPNTDFETRLRLAVHTLSAPPEERHCVAWLTYGDARLNRMGETYGPFAFYELDWAVPNAREGDGQWFEHRDEVRQLLRDGIFSWDTSKTERNYQVLVRVDLGVRSPHRALEDADAIVQVLVRVAASRSGGATWKRCGPAYLILDSSVALSSDTAGPNDHGEVDHHGQNGTADALEGVASHMGPALGGFPLPPDLTDALRLLHEAADIDSRDVTLTGRHSIDRRTALVLQDAAFEHVASFAQMEGDVLEQAVLDDWAHAAWVVRVRRAIDVCLRSDEERARDLFLEIYRFGPSSRTTSFLVAGRRAEELLALCSDEFLRRSAEEWLMSISDAGLYLRLYARLRSTGDLLRGRARRVRNSLAHGNPVHPVILDSVRDLSNYRVNSAVDLALESFASSSSLADALVCRAKERAERLNALRSGTCLRDLWELGLGRFPPLGAERAGT